MGGMRSIGCHIDEADPNVLVVAGLEGEVRYEFSTAVDAAKADAAVTRAMLALDLALLLEAGGAVKVGQPVIGRMCANCGSPRNLCDEPTRTVMHFCENWTEKKEGGE
ncbi:MAG: hypothetical protein IJT88_09550 [Kiritimatiellae bacterium]|nr:hypothetical protein [Kiritimatiellia bacterium]